MSTPSKPRSIVALLAVTALVAAGCGSGETAGQAKDGGKATSTPAKKKSKPNGY